MSERWDSETDVPLGASRGGRRGLDHLRPLPPALTHGKRKRRIDWEGVIALSILAASCILAVLIVFVTVKALYP